MTAPDSQPSSVETAPVLVCGLGAIGMECVRALLSYASPVRTLDLAAVASLDPSVGVERGDCRDEQALLRAGVAACRAVILVAGESYVNIEGALVARRLNPTARLVVRTAGEAWTETLGSMLGDFVALEPVRLAAGPLALAAVATGMLGHFRVGGALLRVLRHRVQSGDGWSGLSVDEVHERGSIVLDISPAEPLPRPTGDVFYRYDPGLRLAAGNVVTYLARGPVAEVPSLRTATERLRHVVRAPRPSRLARWSRLSLVVLGANGVLVVAVLTAMFLYPRADPSLSATDAFFSAVVMMTGGTYADVFPPFHHFSDGMRLFSILLSIIGTVGIGLLYAWLTDQLLRARFRLPNRRPAAPNEGHVVVVGLGRVGRHALDALTELGHKVAAVEPKELDDRDLTNVPVLRGNGTDRSTLEDVHITAARGLLAATDADWVNFEIALLARSMNPDLSVVVRARDPRFSDNVRGALPGLQVLCAPLLAAKTFVAAALGENVIDIFQLDGRTIFVIEYRIQENDGLEGALIATIAEAYAVLPIAHATSSDVAVLRPWSSTHRARRARAGERLVVLGPSRSLQAIERRAPAPPTVAIHIQGLTPIGDPLALARVLAQRLGYSLEEAKDAVASLPCELRDKLYPHQAHHMLRDLEHAGAIVDARIVGESAAVSA